MTLEKYVEDMLSKTSENSQTISLRLPEKMVNELDEISQRIDETRTNLVERFIRAGIEEFERQFDNLRNEQLTEIKDTGNQKYFLLNTNFKNNKDDHYNMLTKHEASAFYGNWKCNIERLEEGDIVFLYQSGYGIVAYGIVHGELIIRSHNGNKDEWYSKELSDFILLNKPLPAKKCKDITKSNFNFLPTMTQLKKEQGAKLIAYFESDMKNSKEYVS